MSVCLCVCVCVCVCYCFFFFEERYIPFETEVCVAKPVKFTRNSGCLPRDEFLVIQKGDHILMYIYICNCVIVGHCVALYYVVCVEYFKS